MDWYLRENEDFLDLVETIDEVAVAEGTRHVHDG